jgi:starch synthase (maltosyl-transferring)
VSLHPRWRPEARIAIEDVCPQLDDGRYPVKRVLGEEFEVQADIFRDGHDKLSAVVKYSPQGKEWREAPLLLFDNDRWVGHFRLDELGLWRYTIEAWTDPFESWRDELEKKREAGQSIELELVEGRAIVATALRQSGPDGATQIRQMLRGFDGGDTARRTELMLSSGLRELMARCQPRGDIVRYPHELEIVVDRKAARFAAWYEMFPRSQGRVPGKSASFDDCIARLPQIAGLGFDVVYLVPIHPIGRINRKGKNNSTVAEPGEPGSPYAIGSTEGGHRSINPELGRSPIAAVSSTQPQRSGSRWRSISRSVRPDHPGCAASAWFRFRPDGTIKYAETRQIPGHRQRRFQQPRSRLWNELRDTLLFWVGEGVRTSGR